MEVVTKAYIERLAELNEMLEKVVEKADRLMYQAKNKKNTDNSKNTKNKKCSKVKNKKIIIVKNTDFFIKCLNNK